MRYAGESFPTARYGAKEDALASAIATAALHQQTGRDLKRGQDRSLPACGSQRIRNPGGQEKTSARGAPRSVRGGLGRQDAPVGELASYLLPVMHDIAIA